MTRRPMTLPLAALAASIALLAGCNRAEDRTVGEQVDRAIQSTERAAETAADKVGNATERAGEKISQAGDVMADKAGDAAITASVNAELAKDPALSALRIDVDTAQGRVVLRGSAPDRAALERATQLAQAVQGVVAVDNQLRVGG